MRGKIEVNRLCNILSKALLVLFVVSCTYTPKVAGQYSESEYETMMTNMAKGGTPDITVDLLKKNLDKYVILDSRELEEYQVSHIPGSIWVGFDDFKLDRVKELNKDAEILTYCSVGYRSERIGEILMDAGYKNVSNLKGSIFNWVNKGYLLEDDEGKTTDKVHGYNSEWGKWLKKGKVVFSKN